MQVDMGANYDAVNHAMSCDEPNKTIQEKWATVKFFNVFLI